MTLSLEEHGLSGRIGTNRLFKKKTQSVARRDNTRDERGNNHFAERTKSWLLTGTQRQAG